jgi:hypothetical protein
MGEMNTQWSDRDIESLLAGREPTASDLARLAPFIEAMRRKAVTPSTTHAAVVARTLAEAARESVGTTPVPRTKAPVTWRRRFVVVGGAAVAADGAAPGDLLYSVDRALETVGICGGGTEERLQEAVKLADGGNLDQALRHAASAFGAEGDEDSAGALANAAEAVANQGSEQSLEVRSRVSEMLTWMETTDAKGRDFGQGVSERAQTIKDTAFHGNSDNAPGQNNDKDDDATSEDSSTDSPSNGHSSDNPGRGNNKG